MLAFIKPVSCHKLNRSNNVLIVLTGMFTKVLPLEIFMELQVPYDIKIEKKII